MQMNVSELCTYEVYKDMQSCSFKPIVIGAYVYRSTMRISYEKDVIQDIVGCS